MSRILQFFGVGDGSTNAKIDTRRKHIRRHAKQAEILMGERHYNIRDWSMSGVAFMTEPGARLVVGDQVNFVMRFRFPHETVNVHQLGRIVRTGRNGTAATFVQNDKMRKLLSRVLDNIHADDFMRSQAA